MSMITSSIGFSNESLKLSMPNIFGNLISAIQKIYNSFSVALQNFTRIENEIRIISPLFRVKENWDFVFDSITNISVLRIDKDETAIHRTRNMLHDLFE
jgi:hypothetical protein